MAATVRLVHADAVPLAVVRRRAKASELKTVGTQGCGLLPGPFDPEGELVRSPRWDSDPSGIRTDVFHGIASRVDRGGDSIVPAGPS